MLRKGKERSACLGENAKALQGYHHVPGPSVQGMDDHDPDTLCLDVLEEPLKSWTFRNVFSPRTTLVVLIEDRLW
nr:hypothetical protein [Thermogemmatispora sp.]